MKIALVQLNAGQNKQSNIQNATNRVIAAADSGAEFILLPEVFNYRGPLSGQYLYDKIAEETPGESLLPLMSTAQKNKVFILAGSLYERAANKYKVYNTSVLIDDMGIIVGKYRKINLFRAVIDSKEIDESNTFEKGGEPVVCEIKGYKIGLSICFDLRFPELYRQYYKQRIEMIAVPSSFTYRTGELHWETLLRARAIENYCYVLAPNQFGFDGNGVETYGHSMVIDPLGRVLGVLDKQHEDILIIDLTFNERVYCPSFVP